MFSLPESPIRHPSWEAGFSAAVDSEVEHDVETSSSGPATQSTLEYSDHQLPHGSLHPEPRINRRYEVLGLTGTQHLADCKKTEMVGYPEGELPAT